MEREDWLKGVYVAACEVAGKHGSGLREAIESKDDDGSLSREVSEVAADIIANTGEIWEFIRHSRHPEPASDDWRKASTFEGAVLRAAVSALSADIQDILESLATGQMPTIDQLKPADPGGKSGN